MTTFSTVSQTAAWEARHLGAYLRVTCRQLRQGRPRQSVDLGWTGAGDGVRPMPLQEEISRAHDGTRAKLKLPAMQSILEPMLVFEYANRPACAREPSRRAGSWSNSRLVCKLAYARHGSTIDAQLIMSLPDHLLAAYC